MAYLLAILGYALHTVLQIGVLPKYPRWLYYILTLAIISHAYTLFFSLVITEKIDFFHTISLFAFSSNIIVLAIQLINSRFAFLQIYFVPFSIVALVLDYFFDGVASHIGINIYGLFFHISLSIVSLTLISINSVLLAFAFIRNIQLKDISSKEWSYMPSMETLNIISRKLLVITWFVLTISILSGVIFVDDFFAQRLAHKSFFAFLSWVIISFLLLQGKVYSLTRKRVFALSIIANICVFLGYFGSRFIIEFLIH